MDQIKLTMKELKAFIILWSTQSISTLGSSMTNFALIILSYQRYESALVTAMLSVCTYVPYVIMSIFAGAISDRWNKKYIMLASDSFAAFCTVFVWILLRNDRLEIWHLYALNALNGLMNTIQQPAADVTTSLLIPEKHYQKASGMRSFSNSLVNIVTPMIASTLLALTNIQTVILLDLITFVIAFLALLFFIKIPEIQKEKTTQETVLQSAKNGLKYMKQNRGILDLILFLAAINFTASMYNAALPAMILSKETGGEVALGVINMVTGISMLVGSIMVSLSPTPMSRVKVILNTLLLSMSTENFFLAFGNTLPIWCVGAVLGWIGIPIMNANMDVLFRSYIPLPMQGRIYSARNTLQFFTIPIGYFLGGVLVDRVFEPFMAIQPAQGVFVMFFGTGKGSGAAFLFFVLGVLGVVTCLVFRKDKNIRQLEQ
ncbi:MFS transporter [Candidatus Galacturonibacter soehngenii]|uniref:MFS transporter n=1 Tax=Candidatus Galacturonatibacter soehngenii TaxID=2307010 RepID=A0A7V7QP69_9FIRM|nr:MFS transporter [Candidatus Galacturonibacter soehngenii]KAB1440680.1 MFS transporter [Candidatus Galacturonibacter soehngenii]